MSGYNAKLRPKGYCGKYKRFQRVGLRMRADAQAGGNFLFIFDRFLQEKKKSFSHFMGNVMKKGWIAPPSRYVIHSD